MANVQQQKAKQRSIRLVQQAQEAADQGSKHVTRQVADEAEQERPAKDKDNDKGKGKIAPEKFSRNQSGHATEKSFVHDKWRRASAI